MGTFASSWSETSPADVDNVSAGAGKIRELKEAIRQRLSSEHSFPSSDVSGDPTGMHLFKYVAKTGNYTMTDEDTIVFVDTTSGDVTITLPTAVGIGGKPYLIVHSAGTNNLIVDGNGSETINGATTYTTNIIGESILLFSTNAAWWGVTNIPSVGEASITPADDAYKLVRLLATGYLDSSFLNLQTIPSQGAIPNATMEDCSDAVTQVPDYWTLDSSGAPNIVTGESTTKACLNTSRSFYATLQYGEYFTLTSRKVWLDPFTYPEDDPAPSASLPFWHFFRVEGEDSKFTRYITHKMSIQFYDKDQAALGTAVTVFERSNDVDPDDASPDREIENAEDTLIGGSVAVPAGARFYKVIIYSKNDEPGSASDSDKTFYIGLVKQASTYTYKWEDASFTVATRNSSTFATAKALPMPFCLDLADSRGTVVFSANAKHKVSTGTYWGGARVAVEGANGNADSDGSETQTYNTNYENVSLTVSPSFVGAVKQIPASVNFLIEQRSQGGLVTHSIKKDGPAGCSFVGTISSVTAATEY